MSAGKRTSGACRDSQFMAMVGVDNSDGMPVSKTLQNGDQKGVVAVRTPAAIRA